MSSDPGLTVAVTGPTGTFGFGLLPLLQADARVGRVVGVARREFDPAEHGWTKMEYRRGDVRDPSTLADAFASADAVVHLAFIIMGGDPDTTRAVNIEGTLNAFRAARSAGASRFVYSSSVAAYGFHPDNPARIAEDWPTRPAARLRYAREKAELEDLLAAEAAGGSLDLYVLRPPVVLGPHTVGAKQVLPGLLAGLLPKLQGRLPRSPVRLPVPVPDLPIQFVHESDVGQALLLCAVGDGPPGVYNVAGDGVLSLVDVAREFGFLPIPVPGGWAQSSARAVTRLRRLPGGLDWLEAAAYPPLLDTTRAKEVLGWRPQYSSLEALRDSLR